MCTIRRALGDKDAQPLDMFKPAPKKGVNRAQGLRGALAKRAKKKKG